MATNGIEVIPSAKRMVRSLRDMGYEFAAAVADLIDNSIAAKANTVRINVVWEGASSYVSIADNGEGMTPDVLKEALRFGSERDYEDADLGKFGLGLKTASLSQCMKLTVASRWNTSRADINAYSWDVEHIEQTNRWEILPVRPVDLLPSARLHLKETPGTVVIWEQLDRLLDYRKPDGEHARKHLLAMTGELEAHVAMVFHRFLAGEVRGKRLAIYVNENKVEPWDPFARREEKTKRLESRAFRLEGANGRGDVVVEPYVLPSQALFSSAEAFNRASGPRKWNAQQGFYIYRADRMIQSGGWCGLRAVDEHRKLARIAISFNPKLDDEFKINVPKMRVLLPAAIREDIDKWIRPAVKLAEDVYRGGKPKSLPSPVSLAAQVPNGAGQDGVVSPGVPASEPVSASSTLNGGTPSPGSQPIHEVPQGGGVVEEPRPARPRISRYELDLVANLLIQAALPEEVDAVENAIARARRSLET